jgi:hypothetical protein
MRKHEFQEFREKEIKRKDFACRIYNEVMYFRDRLCVTDNIGLKRNILDETHRS